jgi:hypothetical protein
MVRLDELMNVKSVKSQFTKTYHTKGRTKNDGSDKLWLNFDKPPKIKNLKSHVTVCNLRSEIGVLLFAVRVLF